MSFPVLKKILKVKEKNYLRSLTKKVQVKVSYHFQYDKDSTSKSELSFPVRQR